MSEFKVPLRFKAFENVSKTVRKMQKSLRGFGNTLKSVNNKFRLLQKKTEGFRRAAGRMGSKMRGVGAGMTAGLTAPIGLFAGAALKTAVDFDRAMNTVEAKATVTGKSIDDLRGLAKKMGQTTQFSAVDAANALQFLSQAGFTTSESFAALKPSLDLAAASGTDLARTADIMSNIMGSFKLPAEQAARAADVLALTTAKSNVDMEQLAETMKLVAPVAKNFGTTLEETAAVAGLLGNIGIQGSLAGTSMRTAFLGLAAPASKANKILKALGVESVDKTTGKLRQFSAILGDMSVTLTKLPQAARIQVLKEVFGKRGIAGASELIGQAFSKNKNKILEFTKQMNNSTGAADKMAKTINKGSVGAVAQFRSAFEGLLLAFTESGIINIFTDMANGMAKFFRTISSFSPGLLKFIFLVGILVAALGPILIIMGSMVAAAPAVIAGLTAIGVVLGGITIAAVILAIKVILIVAAIGLLIFGIKKLIDNWDAVKAAADKFFDSAIGKVLLFLNPIGRIVLLVRELPKLFDFASAKLSKLTNLLPDSIKNIVGIETSESKKSKEEGRTESGVPLRTETASEKIIQRNSSTTRDARVGIDFRNIPPGTQVRTEGEQPVDLSLGFAGGF